jgi:hypothetical protein
VCIDDVFAGPLRKLIAEFPVKGRIYTVREVQPGRAAAFPIQPTSHVIPSVLLDKLMNPPDPKNKAGREIGFRADRFRPVEPPRAESEYEEEEQRRYAGMPLEHAATLPGLTNIFGSCLASRG